MRDEAGWREEREGPGIPGAFVNWEELTAIRPEEEIFPGTDLLDADRTIEGLPPEEP